MHQKMFNWSWDENKMDHDIQALDPTTTTPFDIHNNESNDGVYYTIMESAAVCKDSIGKSLRCVQLLHALATMTQWHLLQLRGNLLTNTTSRNQLIEVEKELNLLAGSWGDQCVSSATESQPISSNRLQEVMSFLHQSLASCEEDSDLLPFQQTIEQFFDSVPNSTLCISTTHDKLHLSINKSPTFPLHYLARLISLNQDKPRNNCFYSIPTLSEAECFQDTKDIQRDNLSINGSILSGTLGYSTIVQYLTTEIEQIMSLQSGLKIDQVLTTTISSAAQQILNACNRTESGGSSYEILSQLVSNHAMNQVLLRPDSDSALPLEIDMDTGVFWVDGSFCLGLRVHISAKTWYWLCDAQDPTLTLVHFRTTYTNRLAFPLSLTPWTKSTQMYKDQAIVSIQIEPNCGIEQ